jgi:hypothetical protein
MSPFTEKSPDGSGFHNLLGEMNGVNLRYFLKQVKLSGVSSSEKTKKSSSGEE